MPETWTPDQICQFHAYWDMLLEGDLAQRRHARFVPATISKSFIQTKDAALKDDYDEWLARIICYAFSVSYQGLLKEVNRATAETAQTQAHQEGLAPLTQWVKGVMDRVLSQVLGWPDLEFAWATEADIDPLTQAQVNQIYLATGVLTAAEVRVGLGLGETVGTSPKPAGVIKFNHFHDERGRFASGGGVASPIVPVAGGTGRGRGGGGRGGDIPRSPAEEQRQEEYRAAESRLAQIAPYNRRATSISSSDWVPEQRDIDGVRDEYDREVDAIASNIAEGHAYEKHADEVPECYGRQQFEGMINETIRDPDIAEPRPGGGMFFYSRKNNIVVVIDPKSGDNGSAFRVRGGETGARAYINTRKERGGL